MGSGDKELRMRIPGHLPETLPLERLLAYLGALTELLEPARELHLLRIEEGSAVPVFTARPSLARDLRAGWARVQRGEATPRQREARGRLMRLVREDGGTTLRLEDAEGVIAEVTEDESGPIAIGGIQQHSSLTGVLLRVGGKDGGLQLLAEDGRIIGRIDCPRELARAIATLDQAKRRVILPAPAVAELLTVIGPEAVAWVELVRDARTIEIAPFDHRAAVELALMNRDLVAQPATPSEPRQKIKVDRQIVAIARVHGASELYTDDRGLTACASLAGIAARPIASLPLPDDARQGRLALENPDSGSGLTP